MPRRPWHSCTCVPSLSSLAFGAPKVGGVQPANGMLGHAESIGLTWLAEEHRFAWTDLIAELQAKLLAVEQPEELDFSKITATAQPFLPEAEDPSPIFPELELTPRDARLKVTLTGFDRTISVSDSGDENPTPDLQKAVQVAKHHAVSENVEVLHDTSPTHSSKLGSRKSSNFLANYLGEMSANRPLMKRVKFYLDYAAGMLVLLNTVTMLLEFQLEGHLTGQQIGTVDAGEADYGDVLAVLRASDGVFVFIFLVEWLLRLFIDRAAFVTDFADWFDTLCVWSGVVDFILRVGLAQQHTASRSVVILRLMRALKSLRAIRMVRSLRFFRGLRVLVQACQCFLPSLCWSMVLLGVFMTMGALMMGNLLQAFITDEALLLDDRKWLWERYGTAFRATYTLFDVYITVVVFAVIRVISAVFLKDTFDAAQNDAENQVTDKMRVKAQYVNKLHAIFQAIDESGTGMITQERLVSILENPKVAAYFETLGVDVHEGRALFHLLDTCASRACTTGTYNACSASSACATGATGSPAARTYNACSANSACATGATGSPAARTCHTCSANTASQTAPGCSTASTSNTCGGYTSLSSRGLANTASQTARRLSRRPQRASNPSSVDGTGKFFFFHLPAPTRRARQHPAALQQAPVTPAAATPASAAGGPPTRRARQRAG
ncbi:unnamed protein product [Effrenium voratum]|uniref:Ion transport domain-containing protein n=1 Tax=Effrenium voratum TaxID=2562239 RepID=A0AA36JMC4_9DINO|nr:unnamed protein product [Effrenium voratum]